MVDIASGGFRRASGPFWRGIAPIRRDGAFARSNPLVLVYNPGRGDCRVKTWLKGQHSSAVIDGHEVDFNTKKIPDGLHEGALPSATVWGLIAGIPPVAEDDDEDDRPDGFLDVCFDAPFAPDPAKGEAYWWPAPVAGLPNWLNASSIRITPPGHQRGQFIELRTGLQGGEEHKTYAFRVNGVWCWAIPAVEKWTDKGFPIYTGYFTLHALPEDIASIRDETPVPAPDEPMRPCSRAMVKRLYHMTGRRDGDRFSRWMEDVRYLTQTWWGVAQLHGQIQVQKSKDRRDKEREAYYTRMLERGYKFRKPAYKDYDLREWALEQPATRWSGGPPEWIQKRTEARERMSAANLSASRMEAKLSEIEEKVAAADERCRATEEKYADAIRHMTPSR